MKGPISIGSGNYAAGGDINFSDFPLDEKIASLFKKCDSFVHDSIGRITSRFGADKIEYSSERLFNSLSILDIPASVTINIVERAPRYIRTHFELDEENFSTAHIRKAVADVILEMPLPVDLEEHRVHWAARYFRKYGNPDVQLTVIFEDGDEKPVTFPLLRQTIIPHIMNRIFETEGAKEKFKDLINSYDIRAMAEYALQNLRRVDAYHIRYRTLLDLVEDIALQPPHPWFVTPKTSESVFEYDRDRFAVHWERIKDGRRTASFWTAFDECVHHYFSSILAYYHAFLGVGHGNSITIFIRTISQIRSRQNLPLWHYCLINSFVTDCKSAKYSIDDILRISTRIREFIRGRRDSDIDDAVKALEKIVSMCDEVTERSAVRQRMMTFLNEGEEISQPDFELLFHGAIESIYDCALSTGHIYPGIVRAKVGSQSPLQRALKLFPVFISGRCIAQAGDFRRHVELAIHRRLTDTIFAFDLGDSEFEILNGFVEDLDINVVRLSGGDLLSFLRSEDRVAFIESAL